MPRTPLVAALLATALTAAATPTAAQAQQGLAADSVRPARRDTIAHLQAVVSKAERARRSRYSVQHTATAAKIGLPLLNTPQAITVLGRAAIADQGMQGMADLVRYVPGITMGLGEGHRDAPTIRGNASTADFFVDGVRDDAQYLRDFYNVERVEALKGANAMTFGRGGGGGVLNRVTRQADWQDRRAVQLEGGSFAHRRLTLDAGRGAGVAAGRVAAMYELSGLTRGTGTLSRQGVNPTAAVVLGGTTLRAGYEYFADRRTVDRGIPSYHGAPLAAPPRLFFGDPEANHAYTIVSAGQATLERGDAAGAKFRNATRLASYDKFYQNVYPGAVNAAGTQVALSAYNHAIQRHNLFNQSDFTWAAGRGAVKQVLLVGAELGRQSTGQVRNTGYFGGATATATSAQVPVEQPTAAGPVTFRMSATDADSRAVANVAAGYLQEQLSLGEHVQAIAGVRLDRFTMDYLNHRTGQSLSRTDRIVSPRAGLVLKPAAPISFYGTYSVSALPSSGDQFTALTVTTQGLEPERFVNREAGIKWERGDIAIQGALYRLERSNTTAPDPQDPAKVVQTGRQRTSGVEVDVSGSVTERWQVIAGFTTQDARIRSRTSAAKEGATVPLVPRATASLWNRVQVAGPLALGAGLVHQAKSYAAIDNTVTLPAFTRLDGALFLRVMPGLKAQVNVENVLGARYYPTSQGNNNILPGAGRVVRVGISTER